MWKFFILGLAVVVILAAAAGLTIVYQQVRHLSENSFVLKVAKTAPFSVAKINGLSVSYSDYIEDIQTLRKFYENPPAGVTKPSAEIISDQVLSRLVANRLIGSLAEKYKATVLAEDTAKFKSDLLAQFENEDAARKELQDRYGWTLEKYLKKVGEPILLEQKLQEVIKQQTNFYDGKYAESEVSARHILFMVEDKKDDAKIKKQAEDVLARIKKGEDFAALAKQYGSDSTKDNGGDLGWFSKGMMVPEFEDAVFKLEPGQLADNLVQTQYGYHIVKLEEKRSAQNFLAFMDDQFKAANIKILLPVHNPFAKMQEALNQPAGSNASTTVNN